MSLENNLKRIADALEAIAERMAQEEIAVEVPKPETGVSTAANTVEDATTPTTAATEAPKPPSMETPTAPPAPITEPTAPPATESATMTPEDLNAALVEHSGRLGGAEKIFGLMKDTFGVDSITALDASKYGELIAEVEKLS